LLLLPLFVLRRHSDPRVKRRGRTPVFVPVIACSLSSGPRSQSIGNFWAPPSLPTLPRAPPVISTAVEKSAVALALLVVIPAEPALSEAEWGICVCPGTHPTNRSISHKAGCPIFANFAKRGTHKPRTRAFALAPVSRLTSTPSSRLRIRYLGFNASTPRPKHDSTLIDTLNTAPHRDKTRRNQQHDKTKPDHPIMHGNILASIVKN
jgi:hypothetical protein